MRHKWIVVEDAFVARGKGVLLEPKFAPESPPKGTFEILLRYPDGNERAVKATLDFAHSRGNLAPFAMIRAFEIAESDVPKGTEVWFDDGNAAKGNQ